LPIDQQGLEWEKYLSNHTNISQYPFGWGFLNEDGQMQWVRTANSIPLPQSSPETLFPEADSSGSFEPSPRPARLTRPWSNLEHKNILRKERNTDTTTAHPDQVPQPHDKAHDTTTHWPGAENYRSKATPQPHDKAHDTTTHWPGAENYRSKATPQPHHNATTNTVMPTPNTTNSSKMKNRTAAPPLPITMELRERVAYWKRMSVSICVLGVLLWVIVAAFKTRDYLIEHLVAIYNYDGEQSEKV